MSSTELEQILQSFTEFKTELRTEIKESAARLEAKIDGFNEKFDNYQKATQWVVQLSFSLIVSATVVTVISSVFRR
jgi:hypothetical protein